MLAETLERRELLRRLALMGGAGLALAGPAALAQAPTPPATMGTGGVGDAGDGKGEYVLNAREHGVVADGKTDVTAALQRLLDLRASQGGGTVFLPAGEYLCTGSLTLPQAVALVGEARSVPRTNDPKQGTRLLVTGGKGQGDGTPFITMFSDSTLQGLVIFYPEQTISNPPLAYPWTVASGGGDNMTILDCLFINPYQAVDFGSAPSGRHLIRNLYAQPLHRGIYIDRCLDVGRMENVHLWPFWSPNLSDPTSQYSLHEVQGFIIGRTDWELISNCFVINMAQGFRFIPHGAADISRVPAEPNSYGTPGNVMITGGGADMCRQAVHVEGLQAHSGASFCNCQIFGSVVVDKENQGPLRFTGCGMFGPTGGTGDAPLADLAGSGRTSFDHCHFYAIDPTAQATILLHVRGGHFSLQGSHFINSPKTAHTPPAAGAEATHGPGNPLPVLLEKEVRAALVMGNDFYSKPALVDRGAAQVVIANNLEGTDA